jgi:aminotransferase EvaB
MNNLPQIGQIVDTDLLNQDAAFAPANGNMVIPFVDLKRQYSQLKYEIRSAINRVLSSGIYTSGPEVKAFESEFAAFCGVPYCVCVSDGMDAIEIGLRALGIQTGDEVITVANAGMVGTMAIKAIGAVPVFVDIDPYTMTMSSEGLTNAITARTRAVIITHLYGRIADLEALIKLACQYDLVVVEDCTQAHGADLQGRRVGTWGDIGSYSFSPTRSLGALGDAGGIITKDKKIMENIRGLSQFGWGQNFNPQHSDGLLSSMDEIQAAILRAKLPLLEEWNLRRRLVAQTYDINLNTSDSNLSREYHPEKSVFQYFVVRSSKRDRLRDSLLQKGIGCDIHYPVPDHLQAACKDLGYKPGSLPETERASSEVLSLPCFPELTTWEIEQVCAAINESIKVI